MNSIEFKLKQTIREAGELALSFFHQRGELDIQQKSAKDLVSNADIAVEQFLRKRFQEQFPGFGFLGEEGEETSGSEGRWIVDPIDGTLSFCQGFHYWTISIAAEVEGQLAFGAVYAPVLDNLYFASKGQGAFKNEKRIHVSSTSQFKKSVSATGFACIRSDLEPNNLDSFNRITATTMGVRVQGSAALDCCHVAEGCLDAFWERNLHLHDVAAGALIVQEAGGKVSDFEGNEGVNPSQFLSSNGLIHEAMQLAI